MNVDLRSNIDMIYNQNSIDDELVAWVLSVDNLLPSICRLIEITEEQKPNV